MAAFGVTTAYHNEWELHDRVEDVTWERPSDDGPVITTGLKGRWSAIDTPDLLSVAAGLGLSSDAAAIVVWEPKPTDVAVADWVPQFAPKPGHVLRRSEENSEGWIIKNAARSVFKSKWSLLVDKEVENG